MKKIALIVGLLVLVVSVPVGIFLLNQQQEVRLSAAPSTVFSVSPSSRNLAPGDTLNADISVDTGNNLIVSADIVLSFDPKYLEVISISSGPFWTSTSEVQKSLNNTSGKVIYSIYTFKENAKKGTGVLATVVFKAKAAGATSVAFDSSQSAVYGLTEGQNVLASSIPGSYTITGTEATASPVPTATASPASTSVPTSSPGSSSGSGSSGAGGPTTTPAPTKTATPKPTSTKQATPASTTLPVTGVDGPTVFALLGGAMLVILGVILFAF